MYFESPKVADADADVNAEMGKKTRKRKKEESEENKSKIKKKYQIGDILNNNKELFKKDVRKRLQEIKLKNSGGIVCKENSEDYNFILKYCVVTSLTNV